MPWFVRAIYYRQTQGQPDRLVFARRWAASPADFESRIRCEWSGVADVEVMSIGLSRIQEALLTRPLGLTQLVLDWAPGPMVDGWRTFRSTDA